jgi:hypothetical protein
MAKSQSIFRQTALERLSSPEQLDQLMQVTTPRGWLALAAMGVLLLTGMILSFFWTIPTTVRGQCVLTRSTGVKQIVSTASGRVELQVDAGDEVKAGQVIARIVPPDQSAAVEISSPDKGRILQIKASDGSQVTSNTPILSLELIGDQPQDLKAIVYVPPADARQARDGMEVQIMPSLVKREEAGFMLGKVASVGTYPSTPQSMLRTLGNSDLVQAFLAGGVVPIEVRVDLMLDPNSPDGYKWSSPNGAVIAIPSGTLCSADVVIDRQRPIELMLPIRR